MSFYVLNFPAGVSSDHEVWDLIDDLQEFKGGYIVDIHIEMGEVVMTTDLMKYARRFETEEKASEFAQVGVLKHMPLLTQRVDGDT